MFSDFVAEMSLFFSFLFFFWLNKKEKKREREKKTFDIFCQISTNSATEWQNDWIHGWKLDEEGGDEREMAVTTSLSVVSESQM